MDETDAERALTGHGTMVGSQVLAADLARLEARRPAAGAVEHTSLMQVGVDDEGSARFIRVRTEANGPFRALLFVRRGDDYEWSVLTGQGWQLDSGSSVVPPPLRFGSVLQAVTAALRSSWLTGWWTYGDKLDVCEGDRFVASYDIDAARAFVYAESKRVAFARSAPVDPVHDMTDFPARPLAQIDGVDVVAAIERDMVLAAHQARTLLSIDRFIMGDV